MDVFQFAHGVDGFSRDMENTLNRQAGIGFQLVWREEMERGEKGKVIFSVKSGRPINGPVSALRLGLWGL